MISMINYKFYTIVIVIGILFLFVALRIYRGIYGRKFKKSRIIFRTAIFEIISIAITIPSANQNTDLLYLFISLMCLGLILGVKFSEKVTFFYKRDVLYFKRSPIILIIWVVSFSLRIIFEFIVTERPFTVIFTDSLLIFTSGLLMGEAISIIKQNRTSRLRYNESQL